MPEETEITCEYCDEPLSNLGSAFEGPNGSVICPKVQTFHTPKKPEAGSTRPELPPTFDDGLETAALLIERVCEGCNCEHSKKYAELIRKRKLAASVQQEPLSAAQ